MDKTARVWATDQYQSLRLYADHSFDVEVNTVKLFHFSL
jgi:hypothetical protein